MTTTDPRHDVATKKHWDNLTQALRRAVADLDVPDSVKTALNEVLSLHCAWEKREQGRGWGNHDVVHGIGCRMCDYLPSPGVVPLEHRHCQTVEALRQALLPGVSDPAPNPWNTHQQARAWNDGWTSAYQWVSGGKASSQPVNPYLNQP